MGWHDINSNMRGNTLRYLSSDLNSNPNAGPVGDDEILRSKVLLTLFNAQITRTELLWIIFITKFQFGYYI